MKNYELLRHEGPTKLEKVSEFCKKLKIEYIGRVFHKEERYQPSIGELIKFDDLYYDARNICWYEIADGVVQSVLGCYKVAEPLDINDFISMDNFDIIVDLWNVKIEDACPIGHFSFKKDEIKECQKKFRNSDIDVWINGKKITKDDFMSMTECP